MLQQLSLTQVHEASLRCRIGALAVEKRAAAAPELHNERGELEKLASSILDTGFNLHLLLLQLVDFQRFHEEALLVDKFNPFSQVDNPLFGSNSSVPKINWPKTDKWKVMNEHEHEAAWRADEEDVSSLQWWAYAACASGRCAAVLPEIEAERERVPEAAEPPADAEAARNGLLSDKQASKRVKELRKTGFSLCERDFTHGERLKQAGGA